MLNSSGQISMGGTTSGQSIALELEYPPLASSTINDSFVRKLTATSTNTTIVLPTSFHSKSFDSLPRTLWSFGNPLYTGLNESIIRSNPTQITGTTWKSMGGAYFPAAIRTNGTLWNWGSKYNLGSGVATADRSSPVQIAGTAWKMVGRHGGCAIRTDGTLWQWGVTQTPGYNKSGPSTNTSSPIQIAGTTWSYVDISEDGPNGAAITTGGALFTWGGSFYGAIGDINIIRGLNLIYSSPIQIAGTNWRKVQVDTHMCAIRSDGTLWSWGENYFGKLGTNESAWEISSRSSPSQVVGDNWYSVSCATANTVAIKTNGTLWAWGRADDGGGDGGQLGNNDIYVDRSTPTQVGVDTNWKKAEIGFYSVRAIKTNGTLWGWGNNYTGKLGVNASSPVQIGTSTGWIDVVVHNDSGLLTQLA